MHYCKPALTVEQQADLLLQRGLVADRKLLVSRLREVNYYRLSAYWYPYRLAGSEQLVSGTTLEKVWLCYTFDRQLRFLVMDAIERVEVSVRSRMANVFSLAHGAFGHLERRNLAGIPDEKYKRLLEDIERETENSKEAFVCHYKVKYVVEPHLPLWMACELMTFGMMFTMYSGLDKYTQKSIASGYFIAPKLLGSWLMTLNYVRNLCAHHSRLWNRELAYPTSVPRAHRQPHWHLPVDVTKSPRSVFPVLTVLKYLLDVIAPQSHWPDRLDDLLGRYPEIPLRRMGFPPNWKDCPVWQKDLGA